MTYRLIIDSRAEQQALDAYKYYEEQQNGLGERFWDELENCMNYIRKIRYLSRDEESKQKIREVI